MAGCVQGHELRQQSPHVRLERNLIQRRRHVVRIIVEQVSLRVESHRCGRVAEHPLHRPDVSAGRDGEAGGRVAQLVGRDPVESDLGRRGIESALAESVVAQVGLGAHPEEDRLRSRSPSDLLLEHGDEELRDRDGTMLVVLLRIDALVALVRDDIVVAQVAFRGLYPLRQLEELRGVRREFAGRRPGGVRHRRRAVARRRAR